MKIAREPVAALRADPELPRLVLEYHEEVGDPRIRPDPDWERMAALEARGDLFCFTARDDALVGGVIWSVSHALGFRGHRSAFAEFLFLTPEARRGGTALRLLRASEKHMREQGIARAALHDSATRPVDFRCFGYAVAMRVWTKDL